MPRRRANKEGTVFKRMDGRWVAVTPYPEEKHFYGKTQTEAMRKRKAHLDKKGSPISNADASQPLGDYLRAWLDTVKHAVRHNVWATYDGYMRKHVITQPEGKIALGRIEAKHVQQVINRLVSLGLAPTTVRHVRRIMFGAFEYAITLRLIGENPAHAKKLIVPKKVEPEYFLLTAEDMEKWRAYLEGHTHRALALVLTDGGLRLGEALGLRWKDVDFEAGTIAINGSLQRMKGKDGGLRIEPPKSKAGRRILKLGTRNTDGAWPDSSVIAALRKRRSVQLEHRMKAGEKWCSDPRWSDLVFTTIIGTPMEPSNVSHLFTDDMMPGAGIEPRGVHQLRHTVITNLLRRGVPVKTVQKFAGHSSAAMTLDRYGHLIPEMTEDIATAMDKMARGE